MILTGGAAAVLAESLGPPARYVPHLTLAGIALAAERDLGISGISDLGGAAKLVTIRPNAVNRWNSVILSAAKNLASVAIHARFFAALENDGFSAAPDGSTVTQLQIAK